MTDREKLKKLYDDTRARYPELDSGDHHHITSKAKFYYDDSAGPDDIEPLYASFSMDGLEYKIALRSIYVQTHENNFYALNLDAFIHNWELEIGLKKQMVIVNLEDDTHPYQVVLLNEEPEILDGFTTLEDALAWENHKKEN